MYISSDWIRAKALRTVLSTGRAMGGAGQSTAGGLRATAQGAVAGMGRREGQWRHTRAVGFAQESAWPVCGCKQSSRFLNVLRDATSGPTDEAAPVVLDETKLFKA